jgi:hypothetical protein
VSQNYISATFDALFFAIVGLIILVSAMFGSYDVFVESGLRTAFTDFLPSLLAGGGCIALAAILYRLTKNAKPLDFMNN